MYRLSVTIAMEIVIFSKKNGSNHVIVNGELKFKLCRCGRSKTMPLCDSTHKEIGWIAEENETKISVPDSPEVAAQMDQKDL
jgi:CDGSH-type Zn-finger protein